MTLEDSTGKSNKQYLEDYNHDPDNTKVNIFKDTRENVELIIDLSATNHIVDLEEHK